MSNHVVRYSRIIQKSGDITSLPQLSSGEFGFARDAGRLFVGADPALSTIVDFNTVAIFPILNAQNTVQAYLDNSTNYTSFTVKNDLTIDAGSPEMAVELADYINTVHLQQTQNTGSTSYQPIARVDTNIELVTNKNVHQYAMPSDFSAKYGPVERINSTGDKLLYQKLDGGTADVFLEYEYQNALYLKVEYMLIQNNGTHKRTGMMYLLADDIDGLSGNHDFTDNVTAILTTGPDDIEFTASGNNGKVTVFYTQPTDQTTKIFYRVTRWNIENYTDINNYYEDTYIGPLSFNDDPFNPGA